MNSKVREDRLNEIMKIRAEIQSLEKRLDALLFPEKAVTLPENFSVIGEVVTILGENPLGLTTGQIHGTVKARFPKYGITPKRIASAVAYLKKRKRVVQTGRGEYRLLMEKYSDNREPIRVVEEDLDF